MRFVLGLVVATLTCAGVSTGMILLYSIATGQIIFAPIYVMVAAPGSIVIGGAVCMFYGVPAYWIWLRHYEPTARLYAFAGLLGSIACDSSLALSSFLDPEGDWVFWTNVLVGICATASGPLAALAFRHMLFPPEPDRPIILG